LSSYAQFFTEIYPDIRGDYLNQDNKVDSRAVAKAVGAKWNSLSEDAKKVSVPLQEAGAFHRVICISTSRLALAQNTETRWTLLCLADSMIGLRRQFEDD